MKRSHPNSQQLHIACAADEAYIPHCASMLCSLFEQNSEAVIHFLHGPSLPDAELKRLSSYVGSLGGVFNSYCIGDEKIAGLTGTGSRIPALTWYRAYLPDLLKGIDRVLYLDCDTIVCENLRPLWDLDMTGAFVAAVENVMEPQHRLWAKKLGIETGKYFNNGVLLLNLNMLRQHDMGNEIISYGRRRLGELQWRDQDAFNAMLGHRRIALHPRWNCQNSLFYFDYSKLFFPAAEIKEAVQEPMILHFEGGEMVKPWHYLSKHPWRQTYLRCRQQTPWPLKSFEADTMFNRFLRLFSEPRIWKALYYKKRISNWLKSGRSRVCQVNK